MFILTVEGQYYADGKKLKKYSYQCKLPKMEAALSVIKNKIEQRKLNKLLPDFVAVRTRAIVDVKSELGLDAAPKTDNIAEMTLDQVSELIIQNELPIDPTEYTDIIELRKDAADALQNLEMFLKTKKERAEKKAEEKELEELNPDLADDDEPPAMPGDGMQSVPSGEQPVHQAGGENPLSGLE